MQSWGQKYVESATLNQYYDNVGNFFENGTIFDTSVNVSVVLFLPVCF